MQIITKTALGLTLAFGLGLAPEAEAAITMQRPALSDSPIIQVYGGCGPYGHRGPYGGCRPGGQWSGGGGRACPPGFHLGRFGRRCWPN